MRKNRIYKIGLFLTVFLVGSLLTDLTVSAAKKVTTIDWAARIDLPFEMPAVELPAFKSDTFNVIDFGAKGDGFTLDTKAINEAIAVCSQKGGGVVLIPDGIWLTGPVVLKSQVNLHLADGALLLFSTDKKLYPLIEGFYEGERALRCQSPVSGRDLQNIAITGKGTIDGNGQVWRHVKRDKVSPPFWKKLINSSGVVDNDRIWFPSEKVMQGEKLMMSGQLPGSMSREQIEEYKDFFRPVMISLIGCKRVLLEGPTFQNSPAWNIHPLLCEHLTINDISVRNPSYSQNGDGLDLESCRIGSVTNCRFDVGDDAICIKSGKDKEGRDRGLPTELFVIKNNTVYHGHGGFVIGSEMSGGVRNLWVSDCLFLGTDCGLRFKSNRGRGGIVENIYINNIRMTDIPTEAIRFNLYYGGKPPKEDEMGNLIDEALPVNEETPQFRNIFIENLSCTNAEQAINIRGLPEMPVQGIIMKNVRIKANNGIFCTYGKNITIEGLVLEVEAEDAVEIQSSQDIWFKDLNAGGYRKSLAIVKGESTRSIMMEGKQLPKEKIILVGTSAKEVEVK